MVNSIYTFDINSSDLDSLDIYEKDNLLHVLDGQFGYNVQVINVDINNKRVDLHINGRPYAIQVSNELDLLLEALGFNDDSVDLESSIQSPMPGLVLDIQVSAGDRVDAGTPLLILEAMKMENVIQAPAAAIVDEVHVAPSESVSKGALLVSLSPLNEE